MAAAGIQIMCGFKKRKRGFPSVLILYMRESVCTLFFHEDETHLFLYIMRRWGRVVLNFISKKGERINRIDLITAVNFFFFLVEISSSICLQKDRETLFLPMDRALLLRIGYISKWSGKFVCCCCCSLRFELFRSRS
jgi:hypothetical protein